MLIQSSTEQSFNQKNESLIKKNSSDSQDESLSESKKKKQKKVDDAKIDEGYELDTYSLLKKTLFEFFFGKDYLEYNTVAECYKIPFPLMQSIRIIIFLALFVLVGGFFYIFVAQSLVFYSFHSLLFTFLAFSFLLVGSGK